jgi:hypothetical protein
MKLFQDLKKSNPRLIDDIVQKIIEYVPITCALCDCDLRPFQYSYMCSNCSDITTILQEYKNVYIVSDSLSNYVDYNEVVSDMIEAINYRLEKNIGNPPRYLQFGHTIFVKMVEIAICCVNKDAKFNHIIIEVKNIHRYVKCRKYKTSFYIKYIKDCKFLCH